MKTEASKAAALIRKELKTAGIKPASVRSEVYSMGSSVTVRMNDATAEEISNVKSIVNKYQYGHFDGMTDSYEYSNTNDDLPQAKHVIVSN